MQYLHLGGDTIVNVDHIVGVFDLDNASQSRHTKKYLAKVQKENKVINVSMELPKAFVVCFAEEKETVYISQISTTTLLKRMNFLSGTDNFIGNT
ncbi:MAG: DUF370 domain-containing protein [Oscillospiraceae bacterium]